MYQCMSDWTQLYQVLGAGCDCPCSFMALSKCALKPAQTYGWIQARVTLIRTLVKEEGGQMEWTRKSKTTDRGCFSSTFILPNGKKMLLGAARCQVPSLPQQSFFNSWSCWYSFCNEIDPFFCPHSKKFETSTTSNFSTQISTCTLISRIMKTKHIII